MTTTQGVTIVVKEILIMKATIVSAAVGKQTTKTMSPTIIVIIDTKVEKLTNKHLRVGQRQGHQ